MEGNKKIDLKNGNVLKIFMHYAIPGILGMIAMTSAQIIDGIFVGQFVGSEALAAVNLAMPLLNVFFGIGVMIAVGGATIANIRRGEEKYKSANNIFTVSLIIVLVVGAISTIFGVFFSDTIAKLMGAESDTITLVSSYIQILSLFFIAFIGSFLLDMFLRNDGFPVLPIVAMVMGSISNVIFDYLFIAEFGLGIKGAAFATGIAYAIPTVIMSYCIFRKSSWKLVKPEFKMKDIKDILFNGSSELLSNISVGISGLVFNIIIMREIGTEGVAAYSVATYAGTIAMAVYWGVASAIGPGVSFNKGAENKERVIKFRNIGIITSLIFGVIVAGFLFVFGDKIVVLFVGNDEAVKALAITIIKFYSIAIILSGVNVVSSMYYTSINEPIISAVIASTRSLIALITGIVVLPLIFGNNGIWASLIFAEVITLMVSYYYFKKKAW